MARDNGKEVTLIREDQVTPEHADGMDLVVAMGGDHTYLVANSLIKDSTVPLLGLNTYKAVQFGALISNWINYSSRVEDIKRLLKGIDDPNKWTAEPRARIMMTLEKEKKQKNDKGEIVVSN